MNKITIEEIRNYFLKYKLILDEEIYINNRTKMKCHDEDGYYYSISLGVIKDKRNYNRLVKVSPNNKYSIYNIQKYFDNNNYNLKILSTEYINEKQLLKLQCSCGNIYYNTWNHLQQGNDLKCKDCILKCRIEKQMFTEKQVDMMCKEQGYTFLHNKDFNAHNVIVEKDGYKYKTIIQNLKICNFDNMRFHSSNPFCLENMKHYLKINNIPIKMVEKSNLKIDSVKTDYFEWYCIECGNIFKATWSQIINNNRYRCKRCVKRESNNEYYVRLYLEELGIKYEQEKRFDNCKLKNSLPFDFYLPDYNYVIEVHGQQHYYENDLYKQTLQERQFVDKYKKDYCINNNIGYLEIPYWDIVQSKIETYKRKINNILKKE